jgi:hypothetical protein
MVAKEEAAVSPGNDRRRHVAGQAVPCPVLHVLHEGRLQRHGRGEGEQQNGGDDAWETDQFGKWELRDGTPVAMAPERADHEPPGVVIEMDGI